MPEVVLDGQMHILRGDVTFDMRAGPQIVPVNLFPIPSGEQEPHRVKERRTHEKERTVVAPEYCHEEKPVEELVLTPAAINVVGLTTRTPHFQPPSKVPTKSIPLRPENFPAILSDHRVNLSGLADELLTGELISGIAGSMSVYIGHGRFRLTLDASTSKSRERRDVSGKTCVHSPGCLCQFLQQCDGVAGTEQGDRMCH